MKSNPIRLLSLLLALVLVSCAVGVWSFAEEAVPAAEGEGEAAGTLTPETIPNELLLDVDFRGGGGYTPGVISQVGGTAEASADGDSVLLRTAKQTGGLPIAVHTLYWGALIDNLPLGGESYTVTFAVTNPGNYRFGVMLDYDGSSVQTSTDIQGTPDGLVEGTNVTPDDLDGKRYYCVELDGETNVLNFYVLAGGEYQMLSTTPFDTGAPVSDSLALIFYLYGGMNPTAAAGTVLSEITVSDCNIYRGIYRGAMLKEQSPEPDGTLLLEINDLSKDAFNPETGVGYRQSVSSNDNFYEFDEADGLMKTYSVGASTTYVYGGSTNLRLDGTTKYTVSYLTQLSASSGSGLRISYAAPGNSVGAYIQQGQACIPWGVNTSNGYSGYKAYTSRMLQNGGIFWQEGGYAKVDLEINGTVVSLYINDVLLAREDLTNPSNANLKDGVVKDLMSDTLSIVWHEYELAGAVAGAGSTVFKSIRIYSGLLHQETYDVQALALQTGSVADGKLAIRFVGGGVEGTYNRVGFEITAAYGEASDRYEYSTPETYRTLTPPKADAGIAALAAADEEMTYLYGYTLSGVPADLTVTFTVRPFAMKNGNRLYGEAVTFVLENGTLK